MSYFLVPGLELWTPTNISMHVANNLPQAIQIAKDRINGDSTKCASIELAGPGDDHRVWVKNIIGEGHKTVANNQNQTLFFGRPVW
jgi:hypothetical protein